jgi:hypothetical protein
MIICSVASTELVLNRDGAVHFLKQVDNLILNGTLSQILIFGETP